VPAPQNLRAAGDRIEQLLDELREHADARSYERATEILRLVSELYGAGLERVLERVAARRPELVTELAGDDLVGSLLLVHGLHPASLAERVEGALAKVRPLLKSHAGDVELLDLDPDAGAVHLRLLGSCDGCPSSSETLQLAVERAIVEAAPEVVQIDVEQPSAASPGIPVRLSSKPAYDACPSEMSRA
jgi:Fe-S cluster biogenesis protein NfuA